MFQDLTQIHKMYLLGYVPHVVCVCFQLFPLKETGSLLFLWPHMIQFEVALHPLIFIFVSKLKKFVFIFFPTVLKWFSFLSSLSLPPSFCPFSSDSALNNNTVPNLRFLNFNLCDNLQLYFFPKMTAVYSLNLRMVNGSLVRVCLFNCWNLMSTWLSIHLVSCDP